MKLNEIEKTSAIWQKIEEELKSDLDTLRKKNDNDLTDIETARLRGQISFCKKILSWAERDPIITED